MNQWKPVIFAALIFAIALMAWMFDEQTIERQTRRQIEQELIVRMSEDEVARILLTNPHGHFEVQRRDDKWQLVEPIATPADTDTILVLLQNWLNATRRNEFEIGGDVALQNYGLKEPDYALTIASQDPDEKRFTILVGSRTSTGEFYAMVEEGDSIFVLSEFLKNNLDRDLYALRFKQIFKFDVELATALSIDSTTRTLALEKEYDDWYLKKPVEYPAAESSVTSLLSAISGTKAADFVDSQTVELAEFGLKQPQIETRIRFHEATENDRPATGSLGINIGSRVIGEPDRFWASASSWNGVVKVHKKLVDALTSDPDALRMRQLITLEPDEIQRVDVRTGKNEFTLVRDENNRWTFADTPEIPVDQNTAREQLAILQTLQARSFVTDSPENMNRYGLEDPKMRVSLTGQNGETQTILVGAIESAVNLTAYAKLEERPTVFTISIRDPQKFYWVRNDFRVKNLFEFSGDQVAGLLIVNEVGGQALLEQTNDGWILRMGGEDQPRNFPAANAQKAVEQFAQLKYSSAILNPPVDLEMLGLEPPILAVTALNEEGNILGKIELGGLRDEKFYLRRNEKDLFQIERRTIESFRSALLSGMREFFETPPSASER